MENRSWSTGYRGRLAIRAGQKRITTTLAADRLYAAGLDGLGTAELIDCVRVERADAYRGRPGFDGWAQGPWCWILDDVRALTEPVACRGRQGLFDWQI